MLFRIVVTLHLAIKWQGCYGYRVAKLVWALALNWVARFVNWTTLTKYPFQQDINLPTMRLFGSECRIPVFSAGINTSLCLLRQSLATKKTKAGALALAFAFFVWIRMRTPIQTFYFSIHETNKHLILSSRCRRVLCTLLDLLPNWIAKLMTL